MRNRHADEWIDLPLLVDESFPVGKFLPEQCLANRRGVGNLPFCRVRQRRPGHTPDFHFPALDGRTHFDRRGCAERLRFKRFDSLPQGRAVAQGFFGGGVGMFGVDLRISEERVGGGDDIFDFGTGLRLQQRYRVDQHSLIGNQGPRLSERCDGSPCIYATLEYGARFHVRPGRQGRQRIVGTAWIETGHMRKCFRFVDASAEHVE